MKKIIFFVLFLSFALSLPLVSSAHSVVSSPNIDNVEMFKYNPTINIMGGVYTEAYNCVPLNSFKYVPKAYYNAGGDYHSFSDGYQNIIDFKYGLDVGSPTEPNIDNSYIMSSCLYNPLHYLSFYYSSPITLYNSADRIAINYCYSDVIFTNNNDINLSVEGDIILYYSLSELNTVAVRVPLSTLDYKLISYWEMVDYYYSQGWLNPPADTVVPTVNSYIRNNLGANAYDNAYCVPQPHIIARNYVDSLNTTLPSPIGYRYDNITISVESDSTFYYCDNNIYSLDNSDTNGDNYITVLELQGDISYDVNPYADGTDGYGIIASVESILSQPFLLNISYINWLYILAGLTLFRYLLKLFMGG